MIQNPTVTVKAIFTSTGFEKSTSDEDVGIVLDTTSFYAEQGGQVNNRHLSLLVSYFVVFYFATQPFISCTLVSFSL